MTDGHAFGPVREISAKRSALLMLSLFAHSRLLLSLIPVVATILVASTVVVRVLSVREQGQSVAM